MNPERQRSVIAEACHHIAYLNDEGEWCWKGPHCKYFNPLTDLNAMQSVLTALSNAPFKNKDGFQWTQRSELLRQLELVVQRDSGITDGRFQFELVNATAVQRAEAFLRTLGKWEEDTLPVVPATGSQITQHDNDSRVEEAACRVTLGAAKAARHRRK